MHVAVSTVLPTVTDTNGRWTSHMPASRQTVGVNALGMWDALHTYERGETIFAQGDASDAVLYVQKGSVKLSVLSKTGREGVVGVLMPGDFFGEGCLAGQVARTTSATSFTPSVILSVGRSKMAGLMREQPALSERFLGHMLARNIRIEADLADQLFNPAEKRLARVLLLLARSGKETSGSRVVPKISQETLAEMVGTTRARVNCLLNAFRRRGFVTYGSEAPLTINDSLSSVVLGDQDDF
jgi:CRP-like cAMP-binding protein